MLYYYTELNSSHPQTHMNFRDILAAHAFAF